MALIGNFTVIFAGSVGLLTSASRAEVFAATAAYAAVLVVFVSGNPPGGHQYISGPSPSQECRC